MNFNLFRYLALGDSLTVGVGVPIWDPGFVEYYRGVSQRIIKEPLLYQKYAISGATTEDVLNFTYSQIVTEAIKCANIITITAGGDDLINAARQFIMDENKEDILHAIKQSQKNYINLLERIHRMDKQDKYIIRLMTLYNPFPDIPVVDEAIKRFNVLIKSFGRETNVKVADIYSVFKGNEQGLLSKGGVHPNSKGYYQMALDFSRLGYSPLV
ncbi:MAG TPA: spore gernimation protein [Bacillales bacterium]|nr:spore gernimation protein [Bacillales bacterium]